MQALNLDRGVGYRLAGLLARVQSRLHRGRQALLCGCLRMMTPLKRPTWLQSMDRPAEMLTHMGGVPT